jgi:hypothetical protein
MQLAERKILRAVMHGLRPLFDQVPESHHAEIWLALGHVAIVARLPEGCPDYYRAVLIGSTISASRLICFDAVAPLHRDAAAFVWLVCEPQLAAFTHPDALAWLFQYWREPEKDEAYETVRGGKKMSKKQQIAATQIFTDPYMVQWLLQNSLGRSYHEAYPDSALSEQWPYYIRWRPEGNEPPRQTFPLAELTVMDPCCGAGLFLREAFDMLCAMYKEQEPQWDTEKIANLVLEHHIFGVDLDPMVAAVARLVVYLRAWEYVTTQYPWDTEAYRPSAPLNILGVPADVPEPLRTVGSLYNPANHQGLTQQPLLLDTAPHRTEARKP